MARQSLSEGVNTVVVTPHLDPAHGRGATGATVQEHVTELRQALAGARVPLRVETGHELFLTPEAPDLLRAGRALCLGNSRAVLVEFSLSAATPPPDLADTLFRLQLAGYQPVVAHPERYPFVARAPGCLDDLVDRGVVLQLTAPSFLGEYGHAIARVADRLLLAGRYAIAASDRHRPGQQRSLAILRERLAARAGKDAADQLLTVNPARILVDQKVSPVGPLPRPTWRDRWRRRDREAR